MGCKLVKFPQFEFREIYGRAYGLLENFQLQPCAIWALLWINMAENRNYPVIFGGSLPCRISVKSVEMFKGHMEKSIYGPI
jgi:hypothetical protein